MGRYTQLKSGARRRQPFWISAGEVGIRCSATHFKDGYLRMMESIAPLLQYDDHNMTLAICLFVVGDVHIWLFKTNEILLSYP